MIKKLLFLILTTSPIVAENFTSHNSKIIMLTISLTKIFTHLDDRTYVVNRTIYDNDHGVLILQLTFQHQANGLWSLTTKVEELPTTIQLDDAMTKSNLMLIKFNYDGSLSWVTDSTGTRIDQGVALVRVNYITGYSLKSIYLHLGTIGLTDGVIEGDASSSVLSPEEESAPSSYESAF